LAVISPLFIHRELRTLTHAELGAELGAAREYNRLSFSIAHIEINCTFAIVSLPKILSGTSFIVVYYVSASVCLDISVHRTVALDQWYMLNSCKSLILNVHMDAVMLG